ncbi:MAG: hypothetical protein KBS95_07450, partial [Alistipes sp.]|nr:hypothetical protein [Candidatus Alistipes equi]
TLSKDEWKYLFNTRTMVNDGDRYENLTELGITVEGVTFNGVVLFPDDFTEQTTWKEYTTWKALNDAGLVFLPATGCRIGKEVISVGDFGRYWSSTASDEWGCAYSVFFRRPMPMPEPEPMPDVTPDAPVSSNSGFSVRLITKCQ